MQFPIPKCWELFFHSHSQSQKLEVLFFIPISNPKIWELYFYSIPNPKNREKAGPFPIPNPKCEKVILAHAYTRFSSLSKHILAQTLVV